MTKILRVTLADIVGVTGPAGAVTGEVWARYSSEVRLTDGTIVVLANRRKPLDAAGVVDFTVIPNNDASIHTDYVGFGIVVGWDLTYRGEHGQRVHLKETGRTITVTSADSAVVAFGLKAPAVPVIPLTSYITEGAAHDQFVSKIGGPVAAFAAIKAALADGTRSTAIQILGDSTGNDTTDWPYRLAQLLAPLYPAWSFHHRLWADSTQTFNPVTVLQTGTAGARYLDGSTGSTCRYLDPSVSPYLAGVIDVQIKLSLTDWTPAAAISIAGKSGADPVRGWFVGFMATTGRPSFTYSTDGTAATQVLVSANAAPVIADGATTWIRWVFNPNNAGSREFKAYQSTDDGVTWTQLGTTITGTSVTVFNNSARGYEVGGAAAGAATTAKTYEVKIRDGLDGPIVAPVLPELWGPTDTSSVQPVGAPILTFVNGSHPGADLTYLADATRIKKLTPPYGQAVAFLSCSHNQGRNFGAPYLIPFDAWRLAAEAQLPGSPSIVLTQNPETSGTTWYREHAKRHLDLIGYARQKGLGLIDTYQAFIDAGWPGALMADAVHPNATGSDLWRDAVKAAFDAS